MTHPLVDMALLDVERDSSAVLFRPHREVQPADRPTLFEDEFIPVSLRPIRDVEQYPSIANHLLFAHAPYIHGAPRQVVRRRATTRQPIHLRTPIPARNDHGHLIR